MDHLLHFILHKAVAAECTHYGVMEHGLVWGDVAMGDPSRCRDPGLNPRNFGVLNPAFWV